MDIFLDEQLIKEFRDTANDCIVFRNSFLNIDGRNKWNIICSAMDWISVTSRGIKFIQFKEPGFFKSDDYQSLVLMQYIVAVDVLVESIIQLYRVLFGTDDAYPLKNHNSVFLKNIPDDQYFKHLRAAFGTHPINLKSLDGSNVNSDERFYASWSNMSTLSDTDFHVYLYSNKPEKTGMFELGGNFSEINEYCRTRYNLLIDLKAKVKELNKEIENNFQISPIPVDNDVLTQVKVLLDENHKRIGRTYGYWYDLTYIQDMLVANQKSNTTDHIVDEYIAFITSQIENIKQSIQDMSFSFSFKRASVLWNYEASKIYTYLDTDHPLGKSYFNKLINIGFLPAFLLNVSDKNIMLLYYDAYIHYKSLKTEKAVDIRELISGKNPNVI